MHFAHCTLIIFKAQQKLPEFISATINSFAFLSFYINSLKIECRTKSSKFNKKSFVKLLTILQAIMYFLYFHINISKK